MKLYSHHITSVTFSPTHPLDIHHALTIKSLSNHRMFLNQFPTSDEITLAKSSRKQESFWPFFTPTCHIIINLVIYKPIGSQFLIRLVFDLPFCRNLQPKPHPAEGGPYPNHRGKFCHRTPEKGRHERMNHPDPQHHTCHHYKEREVAPYPKPHSTPPSLWRLRRKCRTWTPHRGWDRRGTPRRETRTRDISSRAAPPF